MKLKAFHEELAMKMQIFDPMDRPICCKRNNASFVQRAAAGNGSIKAANEAISRDQLLKDILDMKFIKSSSLNFRLSNGQAARLYRMLEKELK